MTSAINVNSINVNYPNPGVNNSSQGFRDNFAGIKTNIDIAKTELEELQSKVLVKSALAGTTLDNDMNNGIISNVQTLGFRASTYNLGSNLTGTIDIDCSLGDVHYGTISTTTANTAITLAFINWIAPADTLRRVEVVLRVTAGQTISIDATTLYGLDTVEGYNGTNITIPADVTQVHYLFSTTDCGPTLTVTPVDRPRQATQIDVKTPTVSNVTATGTITTTTSSAAVTGVGTLFTTEMVVGRILLSSANVSLGTVSSISSDTSLTLAANANAAVTGATYRRQMPIGALGDRQGAVAVDGTYLYVCTANYDGSTAIWKRITPTAY